MSAVQVLSELDAHEQPSDEMRAQWKAFSRMDQPQLLKDPRIDDPRQPPELTGFRQVGVLPKAQLAKAFQYIGSEYETTAVDDVEMVHHPLIPGLIIVPDAVPEPVQVALINKMVHRDLSNPKHQTNLHVHYDLPYPAGESKSEQDEETTTHSSSFFSFSPDSPDHKFQPLDPSVHKPLSMRQALQRRLHWVTLGGQYDWTNRVYPGEEPPRFPEDISNFLQALFPATLAQAAIVNFYTPGDTMMMHRDVSEEVNKGLISLSFGCDCLFMIAPSNGAGPDSASTKQDGDKEYLLLRLRSGDIIYMTDESRYAWHGVPKVLKDTCPQYLADWPAKDGMYEEWRGWMRNKRINLNVRQMKNKDP